LCPDIPPGEGFVLQGSPMNMLWKNFQFNIKKCSGKPNCKSEEEIDFWLRDIQVDNWVVQQSMDFNVYGEKPIFYN
jgi:hypothetical protein